MKSLASNENDYVAVQVRAAGPNQLHIQGAGPSINRNYGVSATVTAPSELVSWFEGHTGAKQKSLAGTGQGYTPAQATIRDESVHFQVGGSYLNRSYGAAFDIDNNDELRAFVEKSDTGSCDCGPEPVYDVTLS